MSKQIIILKRLVNFDRQVAAIRDLRDATRGASEYIDGAGRNVMGLKEAKRVTDALRGYRVAPDGSRVPVPVVSQTVVVADTSMLDASFDYEVAANVEPLNEADAVRMALRISRTIATDDERGVAKTALRLVSEVFPVNSETRRALLAIAREI